MTQEEKAREIANNYGSVTFIGPFSEKKYSESDCVKAILEMAQWKDEQLKHARNEARDLYNEISACIGNLVKGRLDKNGIRESNALAQMESLMVKTEQFLLTI